MGKQKVFYLINNIIHHNRGKPQTINREKKTT